jgi:hypothetical protein
MVLIGGKRKIRLAEWWKKAANRRHSDGMRCRGVVLEGGKLTIEPPCWGDAVAFIDEPTR